MERYLNKVKELLSQFKKYVIWQVPRSDNSNTDNVDALARLASAYETDLRRSVPVEVLNDPSIDREYVMDIQPTSPI